MRYIVCFLSCLFAISAPADDDVAEIIKKHYSNNTIRTIRGNVPSAHGDWTYEIHTPLNLMDLARETKAIIEEKLNAVVGYFEYAPQSTIHFLIQSARQANGAATVFPRNLVWIFDYQPDQFDQLSNNKDWLEVLMLHEFTHILHMDMTTGFLGFFRNIFGSAAKLGGVVPRWFSEGIAVWVESEFTGQGRLYYPSLRWNFYQQLIGNDRCNKLECLDEPSHYPYGSYAYWGGSYFMEYLEKKKPGSIRCLIRENSDSIPFFLNTAFQKCVQGSAEGKFREFRAWAQMQVEKWGKENNENEILKLAKPLRLDPDWQVKWYQGYGIVEDTLGVVIDNDRIERFAFIDLKTGKKKTGRLDKYIYRLYSNDYRYKGFYSTTYNPVKNQLSRDLVLLDRKKANIKKEIEIDGDLHFLINNDEVMVGKYSNSRWRLYKKNIKQDNKDKRENSLPFIQLPPHTPIHSIRRLSGNQFALSTSRKIQQEKKYGVHILDWDTKKITKVFETSTPFSDSGSCGKSLVYRSQKKKGGDLLLVNLSSSPARLTQISSHAVRKTEEILVSDRHSLIKAYGPKGNFLYHYEGDCNKFLNKLSSGSRSQTLNLSNRTALNKRTSLLSDFSDKENWEAKLENENKQNEKETKSYPAFRHFLPTYWLFYWNSGATLETLQFSTAIGDPWNRHRFGLNADWYYSISKWAPGLSYTYNPGKWYFSVGHSEGYRQNEFTLSDDRSTYDSASLGLPFSFWGLRNNFRLFYTLEDTQDFISARESNQYGGELSMTYLPTFIDDFWRSTSLNINGFQQKTNIGNFEFEEHLGIQAKAAVKFRFHERLNAYAVGSYGRLFKNSLVDGVLYGGGSTSDFLGPTIYHEFLGLAYTDVFGNKISTGRFQLEWLPLDLYKGSGLTPIYFKKAGIIAGIDHVKADRIIADRRVFLFDEFTSVYGGLRFDVTLAYLLRVEIDLIYTSLLEDDISEEKNSLLILLKGKIF